MQKNSFLLCFILAGIIICESEPVTAPEPKPIELYQYANPTHEEQVLSVARLANTILRKARWHRNFDSESCPEFEELVCPPGEKCYPPTVTPPYPPNVCDLPEYLDDPECSPKGECNDPTKCPVPLCMIELERRIEVEGALECQPDECKEGGKLHGTEHCRPVTRCDLKYWEGILKECKEPETTCQKFPALCVNICDVTFDYSLCTYNLCYEYPQLAHCKTTISPPECKEVGDSLDPNRTCCVGTECYEGFKRCKWGYMVGKRVAKILSVEETETETVTNNIKSAECLTTLSVQHTQPLIFECFKDGVLPEGYVAADEEEFANAVSSNTQEGDTVTYSGSTDTLKREALLENNTKEVLQEK
jgi:hypothetical protein